MSLNLWSHVLLTSLLLYVLALVIAGIILFLIIKVAVRSALEEHYKTVRWYEQTGEWKGKRAPRAFETQLTSSK